MAEKRKFSEIELPILNQKIEISEMKEQEERAVKLDLTRRLRGKSLEIIFKIKKENGIIKITPYRLNLLGYFVRRMMRKSADYVEDSFSCECKNALLKIKPFLVTRKKVSRRVRTALRNKTSEEIREKVKDKIYEDFFSEVISGRFQKALSLELKKIYPLSFCDIRDIYVEKELLGIKTEKIS